MIKIPWHIIDWPKTWQPVGCSHTVDPKYPLHYFRDDVKNT